MTGPIAEWQLERYLLGELPEDEARAVAAAVESDEALRRRVAELEASSREILSREGRLVVAGLARRLRPRTVPVTKGRPLMFLAAAALALAAVGLAVRVGTPPKDETRVKGADLHLWLFQQQPEGDPVVLAPGATVAANEVVQVAYQVARPGYGVIVSVDGRGVVTLHYPEAGAEAAPLTPGRRVPLPRAYRLDDAPAFERFHLVVADDPFPVETAIAAARRAAGRGARELELPAPFAQFEVAVRKEVSR